MPLKQSQFSIINENLIKAVDVDGGGDGRDVPINMNWTDSGYLTKDTGFVLAGDSTSDISHSLFFIKRKMELPIL